MACVIPAPGEIIEFGALIIPNRRKDLIGITEVLPTAYVANTKIIIRRPDIIRGRQKYRGLSSEPPVNGTRFNKYGKYCEFMPGYWGETDKITEGELAMTAEPPTGSEQCFGKPLNGKKEIGRIQFRQTVRMLQRMESNVWDTLRTGRYIALDENGNVVVEENFNIRFVRATVPWTSLTDSAPLALLRGLPEKFRNTSAKFRGRAVKYYMNNTTVNYLLANRNPNDIGKGNLSACCNTINLEWINAQLDSQGLGMIVIYDNVWTDDNDGVHLYIPDGWVIVVGTRPDATRPGNYFLTLVLNDSLEVGSEKGIWYYLHDSRGEKVTREITVGTGHNGGPILAYPEMVISLRVF